MKVEPIEGSETSAISTQTPGKHPKENIFHIKHGESFKSRSYIVYCTATPKLFSLDVQPDDSLLEAETCSCYLLPSFAIYNNIVVF
jgi:hypothetical protein